MKPVGGKCPSEEQKSKSTRVGQARAQVYTVAAPARNESPTPVYLHGEFWEWLTHATTDIRLKRRANLVLRQLLSRGRPNNVKSVRGAGRGWLRAPLGGTDGMQFYLWWAPAGAAPLAGLALQERLILVRAARHHDDTDQALEAGDPTHWIHLEASELAADPSTYGYAFRDEQRQIAASPAPVRFIKGHPGSGKTTALWLSASYSAGSRAIYVTYSRRLAVESERYLQAFGPRGMSMDVLTFEELLEEFETARGDRAGPPLLPPEEAAGRMADALAARYRERWLPWESHAAELYAELHAQFAGHALPIALRGTPPASLPVLGEAAYLAIRREIIGEQAAQAAARVGEFLWTTGALPDLLPGPLRARAALDGLLAGQELPARLRDLDWIFVDEVQDLTMVEALLLVELAARLSRERDVMPGFVAAGDEGQTVRPTDFRWGPLADLLNDRFATQTEYELLGNVRSPRNIASVVNHSWGFYRQLERSARPRGRAEAEIDETTAGRIIYCRARTPEALRTVVQSFAQTPSSALIFPGYRVPPDLQDLGVEIWSSDSAKGLDFQVVGVLDVGRQLQRLQQQALAAEAEGRLLSLWARTLADQLRVALSRSTDTLVLIDRGDDPAFSALVFDLCSANQTAIEGYLEEMEPADLARLLGRGDADAQTLVHEHLDAIGKVIHNEPARALELARQACGLLGSVKSPGAVTSPALRKEVYRTRGVAALLAAMGADGDTAIAPRFAEANLWLGRKAALREAAKAALWVRDLTAQAREEGQPAHEDALALAGALEGLARDIPEAEPAIRQAIVRWCRTAASQELPPTAPGKKKLEEAITQLEKLLCARHPELRVHRETIRTRVTRALFDAGHMRDALLYLEMLEHRDHRREGECHERLRDYRRATEAYERSGDHAAALRCARRVPDFEQARRLAGLLDDAVAARLQWVDRLRVVLGEASDPALASLTSEEKKALLREAERALTAALGGGVEGGAGDH